MKSMLSLTLVAIALAAAPVAAQAQEALAKSSGCLNCHDVSAKKAGPSFKDVAAKYKGKADAEATLTAKLSKGEGHPAVKTKPEDTTSLVKWILSM